MVSEILLQILKGEPKEKIPDGCKDTGPLVLGLSVFAVTRWCNVNLGVKGLAELCSLVSSEAATEKENLDAAFVCFQNLK